MIGKQALMRWGRRKVDDMPWLPRIQVWHLSWKLFENVLSEKKPGRSKTRTGKKAVVNIMTPWEGLYSENNGVRAGSYQSPARLAC